MANAASGPEALGVPTGSGGIEPHTAKGDPQVLIVHEVQVHHSGFGRANHPILPDGRVKEGNIRNALPGESQHLNHVVGG